MGMGNEATAMGNELGSGTKPLQRANEPLDYLTVVVGYTLVGRDDLVVPTPAAIVWDWPAVRDKCS